MFPPSLPPNNSIMFPHKRYRRSATTVMAGYFDDRPQRDALTSLLNGVGPYKVVEKDEEERRLRKKEKKERAKKRARGLADAARGSWEHDPNNTDGPVASTSTIILPPSKAPSTSAFWRARPTINIATMQRSVSVTPPPTASPLLQASSPGSTPGPSISSSTSRTSSKRPLTPDDDEDLDLDHTDSSLMPPPRLPRERKKRMAVKKGWKGWVEGSPEPSPKLINLDAVPILRDRRTRSGRDFGTISVGKDGWV